MKLHLLLTTLLIQYTHAQVTNFIIPLDPSHGALRNASPFLASYYGKYHLGDDWNQGASARSDYGKPVLATAEGKVVFADMG